MSELVKFVYAGLNPVVYPNLKRNKMKNNNNYKWHENLPVRKPDTKSTKYTDEFEAWLKKERENKENPLLYINIYYGDGFNKDTVNYESFCEEFMSIRNSPTVPDKEVLGKYSL